MLISAPQYKYSNYYQNNYHTPILKDNKYQLKNDTISFTSHSLETKLKRISSLHDPYSEITMVSDDEYGNYVRKIQKRPTAQAMVNLLHGYEDNMFYPELTTVSAIKDKLTEIKQNDLKRANKLDLNEILRELYPDAKISIKSKQLNVLKDIENYINSNKGDTKKKLSEIFEPVRETIEDDSFRINPLIKNVRDLKGVDSKTKYTVLELMEEFPNSRNSADVFIINNVNKSHKEIAEAFLTPSRVSIEHIRPQSKNGASSIENYIIASRRMNSLRSSMPLDKFIEKNPQIITYMQKYFDDLINKINRGGLKYMTLTLADTAETLEKESKGYINIDMSKLSLKELKKIEPFKEKLSKLITYFEK